MQVAGLITFRFAQDASACPVRTPSPLASSPHSLQRSEAGAAGNACADSAGAPSGADQLHERLQALVKAEDGAEGCLSAQGAWWSAAPLFALGHMSASSQHERCALL